MRRLFYFRVIGMNNYLEKTLFLGGWSVFFYFFQNEVYKLLNVSLDVEE